jgi:gliding motility-associated-like protein
MKKILHTPWLLFAFFTTLHAQQDTTLSIVSGAAGNKVVGGIEFTWTLGEIAISEHALGSNQLTEGFHQGNLPFRTSQAVNEEDGISAIITPGNEDGLNDALVFPGLDTLPNNDIILFNRWGQVVYKAQPYDNNWKGTDQSGQDLPEGTYYFVLSLHDGVKNYIHGNVLVIR